MVKIRLSKMGKRNAPTFRIVVIDSQKKRDGRSLEIIGHYNPQVNPPAFSYKKDRLKHWLKNGAVMSGAVEKLIEGKYEFKPYEPKPAEKEDKKHDNVEAQK